MPITIDPKPPVRAFRAAEFRPKEFLDALYSKGYRVEWKTATRCPCRENDDSDQPNRDCPDCEGGGFWHHSPVEARATIWDVTTDPKMREWGSFDSGIVRVTMRGEQLLGKHDRITLLDSFRRVTVVRKRAATGVDVLRHPVAIWENLEIDQDGNTADVGVLALRKMGSNNLPGVELAEGVAFEVTADGEIDFALGDALGTAPVAGTGYYTVTYNTRPSYLVENHPHVLRDSQVKHQRPALTHVYLPVHAIAKLDNRGTAWETEPEA